MSEKVLITLGQLEGLAQLAIQNNTMFPFIALAMDWARQAESEIARLLTKNQALEADVAQLKVLLDNTKNNTHTLKYAALVDDWGTFDRVYKEIMNGYGKGD